MSDSSCHLSAVSPNPISATLPSRIPVTSPSPLRRAGSLRRPGAGAGAANFGALRRGHSFMEQGETRGKDHRYGSEKQQNQNRTDAPGHRQCGGEGVATPETRNRSMSLSLSNNVHQHPVKSPTVSTKFPKTPPTSPLDARRNKPYRDWDLESVTSTTSNISVSSCDHASVARNGTTFSGRSMKFVVHCSEHSGVAGDEYLTPTQRAHRQVKRLKHLLQQAQQEIEQKDSDILRLTKEVVELRLYKAALGSPEEQSNSSSDAVTIRELVDERDGFEDAGGDGGGYGREVPSSCADSGHYEDCTNSSIHSKDSVHISEDNNLSPYKSKSLVETADKEVYVDFGRELESEHEQLVLEYERRLQELIRVHEEECHQLKQRHNDKIEELLQKLGEVNTRYWELLPDLDTAKERIKELEQQLDEAIKKLEEQEERQKQSYLQMFNLTHKQEEKLSQSQENIDLLQQNASRISVPDLLHQLQVTQKELDNIKDIEYASASNTKQPLLSAKEAVSLWVLGARKAMYKQLVEARSAKGKVDPEITLQFLKSAIYYFLTDKENNTGHLRAIQSILGFTPNEISSMEKARQS